MRDGIGIVGSGSIGSSLVKAWLRSADLGREILVHESGGPHAAALEGVDGVRVGVNLEDVAARAGVIVVAGEPAEVMSALAKLGLSVGNDSCIVSVGTGVSLRGLREAVGPEPALFRAVIDPGIGLGEGLSVLCAEPGAAPPAVEAVVRLFARAGSVELLPEDLLGAATQVSGSAIGFLALALEGIEEGAEEAGLPRQTAQALVRQTALTTGRLLQERGGSPADLKDQVSSPGGTTIAGLAVLEDGAVRGAFVRAVEQGTKRD